MVVRCVAAIVCRPIHGVRGCTKFVTIRVGNMLAMWAVIRIVWTSLFRTLLSEPICVVTEDMT